MCIATNSYLLNTKLPHNIDTNTETGEGKLCPTYTKHTKKTRSISVKIRSIKHVQYVSAVILDCFNILTTYTFCWAWLILLVKASGFILNQFRLEFV